MKRRLLNILSALLKPHFPIWGAWGVLFPLLSYANDQQSFPKEIPAGNYSGITYLGNDRYAVVSDKSEHCGFFIFNIKLDSISGKILSIKNEGFRTDSTANRDQEGIAYFPKDNKIFISGEADNQVLEYDTLGHHTGRQLAMPEIYTKASHNYGLESLTYNATTHRFWTTSESTLPTDGEQSTSTNGVANVLRLQSFDDNLQPASQYLYIMDAPTAKRKAQYYAMGVSELCALDDGRLLVLEREFFVPKEKLGSYARCKLYETSPSLAAPGDTLAKVLLTDITTRLTLFSRSIANYEGICLGRRLADGSQTLVMISDSQNQYRGVLRDWFKVVVLRPTKDY